MRKAGARAQVYNDNLAGARARGTSHEGHAEPIVTNEVRELARRLLDGDLLYMLSLRRALRKRTAGAIEIWLWRWRFGDPPRAEQATEDTDRKRFDLLRAEVRALIMRPQEHAALEDRILGELPAGVIGEADDPAVDERAGDADGDPVDEG